ncbi:MAG TPA: Gfo/Idh/MocA family oxidoreductase [Longimicrobiales bacterium]|nr:Gfo/Idh/MocA family oxidoreductase [Longimicrobiales bacterium]
MTLRSANDPGRPRLAFVGLGWIGRMRLDAVAAAGAAHVAALCDADPTRLREAARRFPRASVHETLDEVLLTPGLDGVVLATPNALHASQALEALRRDLALFVQKPLGLDRTEVASILEHARIRNRLLAVDYCYRFLDGASTLRDWLAADELGHVHLAEATFHNAYGPDKPWCFDRRLSGGGALLDLGVHLVDLLFWFFGPGRARRVDGWTRELDDRPGIDQLAGVHLELDPGLHARVTASWHAHAGRDCDFRLTLHGTRSSAELRNVAGSFYDFELARWTGRSERIAVRDSRAWMDRAILAWVRDLAAGKGYDASIETSLRVAEVVDLVYAFARGAQRSGLRRSARRSSSALPKIWGSPGAHT